MQPRTFSDLRPGNVSRAGMGLLGLLGLLGLGWGCAAQRVYTLPPQPMAHLQSVADPLVACATQRNWQAERQGEQVRILFDDTASTEFSFDPKALRTMAISLQGGQMTPLQKEQAFASAKQKSDELFACATRPADAADVDAQLSDASDSGDATGSLSAPGAMLMASSMGDTPPASDSCMVLASCYSDIANTVCNSTDAACRKNYTVKEEMAHDPERCQQTLNNIPTMAGALQASRPGWKVPSSCSTVQSEAPDNSAQPGDAAAPKPMSFNGTWRTKVHYTWHCSGGHTAASHVGTGTDTGLWTVSIAGAPQALQAQVNNTPAGFALKGHGDDRALRLCGAFPLRGNHGKVATSKQNNVCFLIDDIASEDKLSGKAQGAFNTQHDHCKISDATVELSR
jgi:hypothetical protein